VHSSPPTSAGATHRSAPTWSGEPFVDWDARETMSRA